MRKVAAAYGPLLWMFCIPVLNLFYGILNRDGGRVRTLITGLDEITPFMPAFVVPYLIWYPFMIAMFVFLFMKSRAVYYRALVQLCLGLVVCYITYFFYQTTVPRPVLTGDMPFYWLMHFVYSNDRPFNCFPSIHVMTTYVILKHTFQYVEVKRLARLGIFALGWAIIVSTVFVKQHVVLDIAGAILLVELMVYVANKIAPLPKEKSASAPA